MSIVARQKWGAKPTLDGLVAHVPRWIMIHHTGTKARPKKSIVAKMRGLQVFSQSAQRLDTGKLKPAWPDVPYHFFIDANGFIAEGRDPATKGDTNTDYNPEGYLQIAVEGNFTKERPAPAQVTSLRALIVYLIKKYGLDQDSAFFHSDKASTVCPGGYLIEVMRKKG